MPHRGRTPCEVEPRSRPGRSRLHCSTGRQMADQGVCIHVMGEVDGSQTELLRFDCFDQVPHYHYAPLGKNERRELDKTTAGNPLGWTLRQLRTRCPRCWSTRASTRWRADWTLIWSPRSWTRSQTWPTRWSARLAGGGTCAHVPPWTKTPKIPKSPARRQRRPWTEVHVLYVRGGVAQVDRLRLGPRDRMVARVADG